MKSAFKHTWAVLTGQEKKIFNRLLLFDIVISFLDILSLAILIWLVQLYIQPANGTMPVFLPSWLTDNSSIIPIAIFFVLFCLKNRAAYAVARAHYEYIGQVALRVSGQNLSGYQSGSYNEFVQTDSSVHIRKIAFQPFEFCQYILAGTQQIITQFCLIIMAISGILLFNAELFFLLLVVLIPPVLLVFYWIRKKSAAVKKGIRFNNERSFQYLLDALKGYAEGNIYDRNAFFHQRFINFRHKFSKALSESMSLQHLPGRVIEIAAVLGLFMLIVIAKWTNGTDGNFLLTVGAFIAAAYRIIPGVVKIINLSGQIKAYEVSIQDLTGKVNEVEEEKGRRKLRIHTIEVRNLSFRLNNDRYLFNNISFILQKGDMACITGVSGKGKTTLLNILCGFLSPAGGQLIFNKAQGKNDPRSLWPSIAYVRQQSFLINDTLLCNITFDQNDYNEARLQLALEVAGLHEMIGAHQEGLDMMITENGKNISGGQQQRISIARAIYHDADLILLDEPFNELDADSETRILDHLKLLASSGKIILLVTHNTKTLAWCNKLISLDEKQKHISDSYARFCEG